MTRMVAVLAFLFCATGLSAAGSASEELQPVPAAKAEARVAETRDFLADLLWLGTEAHWHAGRWDECIRLCRQIIEIDPHFVEAYNGAAWLLWSMDRDDEAIEFYRAGIAANPDRYEIYHDFGMYYYLHQQWDQAAVQFRKSVECGAPMHYQHMLPNALEKAGRKREALEEWRALQRRFPEDPVAQQHIEALEKQLKEGSEPC